MCYCQCVLCLGGWSNTYAQSISQLTATPRDLTDKSKLDIDTSVIGIGERNGITVSISSSFLPELRLTLAVIGRSSSTHDSGKSRIRYHQVQATQAQRG